MAVEKITRSNVGFDLKAVRTGIGAPLQELYSDVLREEMPRRMVELLRQLDQQLRRLDQRDRDST